MYQDIWTPTTGERLLCQTQDSNAFDPYVVGIRKSANIIGHIPRKISAVAHFLYREEEERRTKDVLMEERRRNTDDNNNYYMKIILAKFISFLPKFVVIR